MLAYYGIKMLVQPAAGGPEGSVMIRFVDVYFDVFIQLMTDEPWIVDAYGFLHAICLVLIIRSYMIFVWERVYG